MFVWVISIESSENANNTAIVLAAPFQLQAYKIADKILRTQQQQQQKFASIIVFVVVSNNNNSNNARCVVYLIW